MTNPELVNVLTDLTGGIAHLSAEVGRLAAGQVSPVAIAELQTGQTALREDVAELKAGQALLQADVADLKANQTMLQADVAVLKTDVAELKADMVTVKADVAVLKTDVADLKTGQSALSETVQQLRVMAEHQSQQLKLVAEGHTLLVELRERDRAEMAEAFREVRDLIVFVHDDLRAHIDTRLGGTNA